MSADNCIAVGRFTNPDGSFHWRVTHAQAIENCDPEGHGYLLSAEIQRLVTDAYRVTYYGNAKVFDNDHDALQYAGDMYHEIPYVEYGISWYHYDVPFPAMTRAEAIEILGRDYPSIYDNVPPIHYSPPPGCEKEEMGPPPRPQCYACGADLTPVHGTVDDAIRNCQFDGALDIKIYGGYGMYTDPFDKTEKDCELVLCRDCIEYTRAQVGWFDKFLKNLEE